MAFQAHEQKENVEEKTSIGWNIASKIADESYNLLQIYTFLKRFSSSSQVKFSSYHPTMMLLNHLT